ncbi:hypothetical protein LBMAG53_26910 [Planctomycetota bacterium]|nr:hypothetical protein LBMAG53_26910 [Planctomycetota bacterium]
MTRALVPTLLFAFVALPASEFTFRSDGGNHRFEVSDERAVAFDAPEARVPTARRVADLALVPAAAAPRGAPVLYRVGRVGQEKYRYIATADVVVKAVNAAAAGALAAANGAVAQPSTADGWWILSFPDAAAALAAVGALEAAGAAPEPQLLRQLQKRAPDPLIGSQWHHSVMRTSTAWSVGGTRGAGINITVIDDCLEVLHPDLSANCPVIALGYHKNLNGGSKPSNDPSPPLNTDGTSVDGHGTCCAGLAASVADNSIGGAGVAPASKLFGVRLIAGPVSDAQEAQALGWRVTAASDYTHISTNSWGPIFPYSAPGALALNAIKDNAIRGRGGKGSIVCFAAGNDGGPAFGNDNANYDGYANLAETICVAAAYQNGLPVEYSEPGACLTVAAPSGPVDGGTDTDQTQPFLVTTDVQGKGGYNPTAGTAGDYFLKMNGTSGACPLVAGTCALMIATNPNLGWRDVQEILMRTATKTNGGDPGWATNAGGINFHHKMGAGVVDAGAAVSMAKSWTNLPVAATPVVVSKSMTTPIPDNAPAPISNSFVVNQDLRCEHVTLKVKATHTSRGDLRITLTSPTGTKSYLAVPFNDVDSDIDWIYLSRAHWGEPSRGTWTVDVSDEQSGDTGTLRELTLTVNGTVAGYTPTNTTNLTKVTITEHGTEIGSTTAAPFSIPYASLPAGRHHLLATLERTGVAATTEALVIDISGPRPSITSRPVVTAKEGTAYLYSPTAPGVAAGTIDWSLVGTIPAGMGINPNNGQVTWTPPNTTTTNPLVPTHVPVIIRATLKSGATVLGIDDQFFLLSVRDSTASSPG